MVDILDSVVSEQAIEKQALADMAVRIDAKLAELLANVADPVKVAAIVQEIKDETAAINAEVPAPVPAPAP